MPYWFYNVVLVLVLGGCATFRSYDNELNQTLDRASTGNVDGAIQLLEANNKSADKDLLYYLELGELQRLGKRYDESQKAWSAANARIQAVGAPARTETAQLRARRQLRAQRQAAALRRARLREGDAAHHMALNYLAMGNYDDARVAIKQTHEREARIAELRAAEIAEVEEEAHKRGARTSFKDLNGYPVQTIDNPEVNALRNSYQSALSHYLAGFVYEALGEPSLAAPGYRQAIELQPGQPLLEEALAGLDQRVAAPDDGMTDVLFVVETGAAPGAAVAAVHRRVRQRPLILVPVSFPVLRGDARRTLPAQLASTGARCRSAPITSIDLMARRALQDEMPGHHAARGDPLHHQRGRQYQVQRAARSDDDTRRRSPLARRCWRWRDGARVRRRTHLARLPAEVSIARARLPRGEHRFRCRPWRASSVSPASAFRPVRGGRLAPDAPRSVFV